MIMGKSNLWLKNLLLASSGLCVPHCEIAIILLLLYIIQGNNENTYSTNSSKKLHELLSEMDH